MGMLPPVIVELKAIGTELHSKIGEAKKDLGELETSGNKHLANLQKVGKVAAIGIAAAFIPIAALSVKSAVDYQSSMATIQGSAQLTAPQVKSVGDAFLNTMGSTTFSAQEMATALGPVAGVVKQLSGGTLTATSSTQFMKAAMDAAEATGGDLTATTADLAQVMQSYGLKTTDAGEASNQLYNMSRLTGVGLDSLAQVTTRLHAKLGDVAPSLGDTGGLLVDLAQHGVSGSRGVMVANTALQTLLSGTKPVSTELARLGVHIYDSSGKFVGMQAVLAQVAPKLAGMTEQERQAAEGAIFGKGAAEGLNQTILAGADAFAKAKASVEQKGAVDDAAAGKAKTLKGQMHMVAASAEDLATKFGTLLIPMIQKTITVVGDIVTWLTKHKTAAIALGVVIGGVLTAATVAWAVSLFTAGGALAFLMSPITLVVAGVALLVAGVIYAYNHFQTFRTIVNDVWSWLKGAVVNTIAFVKDHWQLILGIITGPIGMAVVQISSHWDQIVGFFKAAPSRIGDALKSVGSFITAPFRAAFNAVGGLWNNTIGKLNITVPSWVPGIGGKGFAFPQIPMLAKGTDNFGGGLAIVGEQGAELVNLPRGSQVTPAAQTKALLNGGGSGKGSGNVFIEHYHAADQSPQQIAAAWAFGVKTA